MGTVTSSTIIDADGTVEQLPGLHDRLGIERHACVSYCYAYGPALLPPPGPAEEGLWRYRKLLPVGDGPIRYPLAVGGTPLVAPPRLRKHLGLPHLDIKDETRSPTCSNKDRATAVVLELALRSGVRVATCASTGNVAASLAVGAAAAGIEAVIFVPANVSDGKLKLMVLAGATVVKVEAGYAAAFRLSRTAAATFGWCDRNTGVNGATIEGKKTVAFEIWEQLGRCVPDAVVIPVGDGPTLSGVAKGFRELRACGAADRVPRIIGVQAEGCQPVKRAWECGAWVKVDPGTTVADGIAVGNPIGGALALRDVQESGGAFVAVSDDAMIAAIRTLASHAGIIPEPAAASGIAALGPAVRGGLLDPSETVVVLVTGSGLKTPQFLHGDGAGDPVTVQGESVSELEHVLARHR